MGQRDVVKKRLLAFALLAFGALSGNTRQRAFTHLTGHSALPFPIALNSKQQPALLRNLEEMHTHTCQDEVCTSHHNTYEGYEDDQGTRASLL